MLLIISSIVLYVIAQVNYLLFHAVTEGFAITVAALIYVLASRTYKHSRNNTFLFLGIAYFHIAVLDFFHFLTYKGMGVFPHFTTDVPTQLWVAGRMIEAISLLSILFIHRKQINRRLVMAAYTITTGLLMISILVYPIFPVCFVEGVGLTNFKIITEYIIILILLVGATILYRRKEYFDKDLFKTVGAAMLITAVSELAFTLYTDVYGVANALGHILKIASYYYVFIGVVIEGIDAPYSLMAAELKEMAVKDVLTGLYNRQGMVELIRQEQPETVETRGSLGVLMIDLDNFKRINDTYGHLYGDEVLQKFTALLNSSIRDKDTACRYGGDEFVVLVRDVDCNGLNYLKERIQNTVDAWTAGNEKLHGLGISIGSSVLQPGDDFSINGLVRMADKSMYAVKQSKKESC